MDDLSAYSRFVQRLRRRYEAELSLLPPGEPVMATLQACFDALRAKYPDMLKAASASFLR